VGLALPVKTASIFAESVIELTDGRGADVVLNALAAEAIPMGLSCLAESGRFLEIGKRDIYMNSRIPLWGLRRNSSFHVIAMDAIFAGDEAKTRDLLAEVSDLVDQGALTALPFRSFPASRIDAAFRLMAGGKHTGKVVVGFADPFIVRSAISPCAPVWHPCRDAMDLRLFWCCRCVQAPANGCKAYGFKMAELQIRLIRVPRPFLTGTT
jgi:hypothetical protein